MATNIFLPQWGMGMQEATVIKWLKKEGDQVKKGEPLVEVESSKVNAEVESLEDGFLIKINADEGEVVRVGGILAYVGEKGETVEAEKEESADQAKEKPPVSENNTATNQRLKVQVTPIARRVAKDLNISLDEVLGTGPNGRITEDDVRNHASKESSSEKSNSISGMRKVIALRMTQSSLIPSVTLSSKVELTKCINFQSDLLKEWRKEKLRPTFQDILAKAVSVALSTNNEFNAHFIDDEIINFEEINLGIAYAVEEGLVVPVIKNAQEKSFIQIAQEIRQFSKKEKTGFSQNDISGSTFSITSLNSTVVDTFNPLINPPEVGILGVGRIFEEVVMISDKPETRKFCNLNLTFDHRAVDGFPAAKFLENIIKNLQDPKAIG
tara:strand:- start:392 stop:1537 length:1146 start_codon:yes stop_codon:yes gene_type:complete